MNMRECLINSELTLHIVDMGAESVTVIQFVDKQGTIGVKCFFNGTRRYL